MIGAGHRYTDVMTYTLAQAHGFLRALDQQDAQRFANLLTVITTGCQGNNDTVRKLFQELTC